MDEQLDSQRATMIMRMDPSAQTPLQLPPDRFAGRSLRFRDRELEACYLAREYIEHRKAIAINVLIAAALLAAFGLLDSLLLPAEVIRPFRIVRFGMLLPLVLAALAVMLIARDASFRIAFIAMMMTTSQLCWSVLLVAGGEATLGYLSLALVQTTIGTYFMVGLPVRWSTPIVGLVCATFLCVTWALRLALPAAIMYGVGCTTVAILGAFGAYRAEDASRRQFIATRRSQAEYSQRLAVQSELNGWLASLADVLRHELKNAMAGVSTSLDLARRANPDPSVGEYIERGVRSIAFMQRLLAQVANATTLEAALKVQDLEAVNLSDLLGAHIADFRLVHRAWRVEEHIATDLWVRGDADNLSQMLDKLFDNAVAHGDPQSALCITLRIQDAHAVLTIANRGGALPADTQSIFAPFAGSKRDRAQTPHLGLGLYVARTIIIRHQGSIEAERLENPAGASFSIRLPLLIPKP